MIGVHLGLQMREFSFTNVNELPLVAVAWLSFALMLISTGRLPACEKQLSPKSSAENIAQDNARSARARKRKTVCVRPVKHNNSRKVVRRSTQLAQHVDPTSVMCSQPATQATSCLDCVSKHTGDITP